MSASDALTANIIPSYYCTQGCQHCYLPAKTRADKRVMSYATLQQSARVLEQIAAQRGASHIGVVWHGGEPMEVPIDWYTDALECIRRSTTRPVFATMQTSLPVITDDWIRLFHEQYNSSVSVSIDSAFRGDRTARTLQNITTCLQHEIAVSAMITFSKLHFDDDMLLLRRCVDVGVVSFSATKFQALPWSGITPTTNFDYSQILWKLFEFAFLDQYLLHGKLVLIKEIFAALTGLIYGIGGAVWGHHCTLSTVTVAPDGRLTSCIEQACQAPENGTTLSAISASRAAMFMQRTKLRSAAPCSTCDFMSWCLGGCPIRDDDDDCRGFKTFLMQLQRFLETSEHFELALQYVQAATAHWKTARKMRPHIG